MRNNKYKGLLFGVIAAAAYGLNPLFALPLYEAGMGVDSVLFYRYLFAILMLGVLMLFQKQSFALKGKELISLASVGFLFSLSSLSLFESYNYMDVGIASTLLFTYPVLVAIIMGVFFREKIAFLTILSIALALGGILLLCKGGEGEMLQITGVLLVFFSSLTYAVYIVWVNRSTLKNMPAVKLTFYALLFGILLFVFRLTFFTELQLPGKPSDWFNAVSLALFPTIISLSFMNLSIRYIGSTRAAILGALEPVTGLLVGMLAFGEVLTWRDVLGIVLILVAVTLVVAGQHVVAFFSGKSGLKSK